MSVFWETVSTIALAIVGLGVVAVVVSKNANTSQVIQAAASGFNNAIGTAQAPVTGTQVPLDLSYPHSGFGF